MATKRKPTTATPAPVPQAWRDALERARSYFEMGCESRSSLKQGGDDHGIPFGEEMGRFVTWAEEQL